MFVGETGVACNHHFNPLEKATTFSFLPGTYQFDVFAALIGFRHSVHLCSVELRIPDTVRMLARSEDLGKSCWFDLSPDSNQYHAHIEFRNIRDLSRSFSSDT
jgi:hypothetical protein